MKGIYIAIYKIDDFYKGMLDYNLLTLNKLGISYNVIYNKESELEINILYNINTLVNLNNYTLNIVSFGTPRLGLSYYSVQDYYSISRPYPSIIFDLFDYILTTIKSIKNSTVHKNSIYA